MISNPLPLPSQLNLFDVKQYDLCLKTQNLDNSIRMGWEPYAIKALQKASEWYGITCEQVMLRHDAIMLE